MMLLRACGTAMQCSAELVGTRGRWVQQIRTGVIGPKKLVTAHGSLAPLVASTVITTDAAKKGSGGGGGGAFKWIVGTGLVLAGAGAALAAQQYVLRPYRARSRLSVKELGNFRDCYCSCADQDLH